MCTQGWVLDERLDVGLRVMTVWDAKGDPQPKASDSGWAGAINSLIINSRPSCIHRPFQDARVIQGQGRIPSLFSASSHFTSSSNKHLRARERARPVYLILKGLHRVGQCQNIVNQWSLIKSQQLSLLLFFYILRHEMSCINHCGIGVMERGHYPPPPSSRQNSGKKGGGMCPKSSSCGSSAIVWTETHLKT